MPTYSDDAALNLAQLRRNWSDLFTGPQLISVERLNEHLRQFLAEIDARRAEALRITADGRSPRRKVAVRVNADGVVVKARVADDTFTALSPDELAQEFVSATQDANAYVRTKVAAKLEPIDDFLSEMSASMADDEWSEIIHDAHAHATVQRARLHPPHAPQEPASPKRETGSFWDAYRYPRGRSTEPRSNASPAAGHRAA